MKVHLLCIDPQQDFVHQSGSLFVPGAVEDMQRLTAMVKRIGHKLDDIHVTLDSHHPFHIAHPIFWKDSKGDHPNPFTIITHKDVIDGKWIASIPSCQRIAEDYTLQLEKNGRYKLTIWPIHTILGSWGHTVDQELHKALTDWELENLAVVDYVTKGSNLFTEHYSALRADVPRADDPSTQLNTRLVDTIMKADIILAAGEASNFCCANTIRDLANAFGDDSFIKKIVLLEDAMSPVPGFEHLQDEFMKELTYRGMQVSTTEKVLR